VTTTRETHKKKVYNSSDRKIWIEVERLDKLIVETGKGPSYQKTVYNFLWENENDDGTWDGSDAEGKTTIKKIKNPDDESQFVELPIINYVIVETGKGRHYQKTKHWFDNTDANDARVTHTKTVHGSADAEARLDVEVIEKIFREFGKGFAYQKTVVSYNDQGDENL